MKDDRPDTCSGRPPRRTLKKAEVIFTRSNVLLPCACGPRQSALDGLIGQWVQMSRKNTPSGPIKGNLDQQVAAIWTNKAWVLVQIHWIPILTGSTKQLFSMIFWAGRRYHSERMYRLLRRLVITS